MRRRVLDVMASHAAPLAHLSDARTSRDYEELIWRYEIAAREGTNKIIIPVAVVVVGITDGISQSPAHYVRGC